MFENEPLIVEQREALADRIRELEAFVQKYKISPEPLDEDYAEEMAESDPNRIFSIEPDVHNTPANSAIQTLESPLMAGYDDSSDAFFESLIPWEDATEFWPYTEIIFGCRFCEDSDSPGFGCTECTEGQLIYELLWDEAGVVRFERTL